MRFFLATIFALSLFACERSGHFSDLPIYDAAISDSNIDSSVDALSDAAISNDAGNANHPEDIVGLLEQQDEILSVVEAEHADPNIRSFRVSITQPIDHFDEDSQLFVQEIELLHRDIKRPMTIMTTGYGMIRGTEGYMTEPTEILSGNQIIAGHRFFGGAHSELTDTNWDKLNIRQAAADNHRIYQVLSRIYAADWIGIGWSKGGMTAIFHERFYPDDLTLVLPMSAPISHAVVDLRYDDVLENIGTPACRARIDAFIEDGLSRREEVLTALQSGGNPNANDHNTLFRSRLIGYHWSFWQSFGFDYCGKIPAPGAPAFDLISAAFFQWDRLQENDDFQPADRAFPSRIPTESRQGFVYAYQAVTQLGEKRGSRKEFLQSLYQRDLLTHDEYAGVEYSLTSYIENADEYYRLEIGDIEYDPKPIQDVVRFLRDEAKDMIAVYGQYDPWIGGIITLNESLNSEVMIVPRGNHLIQLADLPDPQRTRVFNKIMSLAPPTSNANFFLTQDFRKPSEHERTMLRKIVGASIQ